MISSKKRLNVKELPCHICTIMTPIPQLKAYAQGNWICTNCSERIYDKKPIRPPLQKKEHKIEFNKIEFDPHEQNFKLSKEHNQNSNTHTQPNKNQNIPTIKTSKFLKKSSLSKSMYKCNYCTFKYRYSSQDEICTNCGRNNFLIRIPPIGEVLDDVKRNPIFD